MGNGLSVHHNQTETHTCTLTVKSHQNKTHKQAHTRLAATLTQLQPLFTGGGLGMKNGKRNYYISSEVAASQGPACVTNSAEPSIQLMAGWVLCSRFTRFESNLLSSAPISNFNHDILFVCFFLFFVLCGLHHSDTATTAKPFSHQKNKTTHNTYYHTHTHTVRVCVLTKCNWLVPVFFPAISASTFWTTKQGLFKFWQLRIFCQGHTHFHHLFIYGIKCCRDGS